MAAVLQSARSKLIFEYAGGLGVGIDRAQPLSLTAPRWRALAAAHAGVFVGAMREGPPFDLALGILLDSRYQLTGYAPLTADL